MRIDRAEQSRGKERLKIPGDFPAAPLTLEGYGILHQMFRVRRRELRALDAAKRSAALKDASKLFGEMSRSDNGETALFCALGHKGDLMIVHFRRSFEQLGEAELAIAGLALNDYLEPATSYLSVIEIGLYEATVALYRRLVENGVGPRSPQWKSEIDSEIARQREKISPRGDFRKQARRDFLPLSGNLGIEFRLPLRRARSDPILDEPALERDRRFVEADFDHRQKRRGRFQVVAECKPGDGEFGLAEFLEAAAEVDDHQIALVAERGEERGFTVFAPGHRAEQLRRVLEGRVAFRGVERAQFAAPHAEQLMENAVTFERKRCGGKIAGNLRRVPASILLCAVDTHGGNSRRYAAGCLDARERRHERMKASATAGFDAQCA